MIEAWNRLVQGTWKRLRLVVNTLKEVVLLLCGGEAAADSKISERKMPKTPVVLIKEEPVKIKTGDLVKTIKAARDDLGEDTFQSELADRLSISSSTLSNSSSKKLS
jgi:hypothetical protein